MRDEQAPDNKLVGIAAILASIPKTIWYAGLLLFFLFLGIVIWFFRNNIQTLVMIVFYTITFMTGLGVIRYTVTHIRNIWIDVGETSRVKIDTQLMRERLENMRIKNSRERERLAIDRFMPLAIEQGIQSGKNIVYTSKEIRIEDWKSNMHMFPQGTTKIEQIQAPDYLPEPFTFSDLLQSGFRPTKEGILLGKKDNVLLCPIGEGLCHTTFTGNTDAGKTNDTRLLLIQLLFLHEIVFVCDKNYQSLRLDSKHPDVIYDYRPIEQLLAHPPITKTKDTYNFLTFALQELDQRRELRRYQPVPLANWYIFIDELPAFCAEEKGIMGHVGRIVREARQYGLFFIGAAQDVLLNTLGGDNGAVRKNFLTNFYGGGDLTTAKTMLNIAPGEHIDESGLGKMGVKYIRAKGAGIERVKARVPLADDLSTHLLLGNITPFAHVEVPNMAVSSSNSLDLVYDACMQLKEEGMPVKTDSVKSYLDAAGHKMARGKVGNLMKELTDSGYEMR